MDEAQTTRETVQETDAVLASAQAGGIAIRGGTLRAAGYALGTVLTTLASVVLLRYLGVIDVGRYVTVMSLLAIASGLTDGGLTVIGQREYVAAGDSEKQRRLLADLIAMRLVLGPLGVGFAVAFAAVAGYDHTLVLGTAIGGVGMVIASVAVQLTLPLSANLRLGAVTATEVVRQAFLAGALVGLALAGATLIAFFWANTIAALAMVTVAVALSGAVGRVGPRFAVREWWPILHESVPVAISLAINVLYVRALIVLTSLMASALQTGYFATSYRVLEAFISLPLIMVSTAFPILAHAGGEDEPRLAYALQRIGEVLLLTSMAVVLGLSIGARPVLDVLGGSGYGGAVPVLQIQSFALIGGFLTQAWVLGLIAIRRQRSLAITNAIALATVLILGASLIPAMDAKGAAIAAVAGETVLASALLVMLVRARPALRPSLGVPARLLLAFVVAGAAGLLVPASDAVAATLAVALFLGLALALRAVPLELLHAFTRPSPAPEPSR